jgi:hypothetical protein
MKKLMAILILTLVFTGCENFSSKFSSNDKSTGNDKRPEQVGAVIAANETAALARMRSIVTAESAYQMESGGEYATLDMLIQRGMMGDPSRGKLTGYRFEVKVKPGGFEVTAVPERYGITGKRSFYVDETRQLHGADKSGLPASASDPDV